MLSFLSFPEGAQTWRLLTHRLLCHQDPCGGRCWPQVGLFEQPGTLPLGKGRRGLWVGRAQASQSLNVHPTATGRFQKLHFISPDLEDAKREICTCF